jgi:hypothetical protein
MRRRNDFGYAMGPHVQVIVTTVGFRQTAAREPRFPCPRPGGTASKSYDEKGWRATFYMPGMAHSPTSATGTGWERTPWHATHRRRGRH